MSVFPPLWTAARVGAQNALAHRGDLLIHTVGGGLVVVLNGSLWQAATAGQAVVAGVPAGHLVTYAVVAWISMGAVGTRVTEDLGERFRDGEIVAELLRPVDLWAYAYACDLGRVLAVLTARVVPLLLIGGLLFPITLPAAPLTWLGWGLSLLLGHLVHYGMAFLFAMLALRLRYVAGLSLLKLSLISVLSGALIPLELFGAVAPALQHLPTAALAWAPASVFLERPALPILATQGAWALLLWGLGAWAWRRVARTLTVQGG